MATQLTIDSYVVSSTVVDAPKPAPVRALATLDEQPWTRECVARMFDRKLPVPSAIWDDIKSVVFVAFVRAPLIELAVELQKMYPTAPAWASWRDLHEGQIEIELTMIQLLRIVGLAKHRKVGDAGLGKGF